MTSAICGMLTVVLLVVRFIILNEYLVKIRGEPEGLHILLGYLTLVLIMPYPFLRDIQLEINTPAGSSQTVEFQLNYLLTTLSCLRFIPLAALVMTQSKYLRPRAYRVGRLNSTEPGMLYALQSYFKDRPFSFVVVVFIASVTLFSFALRVAEYRYLSNYTFTAYSNVIWMIWMTMTTVGFGDMSPVTPLGRMVAAICAIWGVLIVAVMVAVLTNILSLDSKETQSLLILNKLESKAKIKEAAGKFIRSSLWRLWENKKLKINKHETLEERKLKIAFAFIRKRKEPVTKEDMRMNFCAEMDREFGRVLAQIEFLQKNNATIIDYLSEEVLFKEGLMLDRKYEYLNTNHSKSTKSIQNHTSLKII